MKSYLKIILSIAGLSAVSTAVFTLTSCDSTNGKSLVEAQSTPVNLYRKYLSEVRGQKELSFGDLTAYIGKWRTLKDSVTAAMHRDTVYRAHSGIREECILLHDSVRSELSRLAMSKPRTYKEVLVLKERFSPYAGDVELCRSAEEIRPFFAELDKRSACRGSKEQILSAYRNVLTETLNSGIHGNGDLKRFIEKEDAAFRAFLSGLHELGEATMADVTRDTEKCCSEVFFAAGRKEITYKDATIYMALRTDRRLIQNVRACLDNIRRGKVTTPEQAQAYVWMILQPYASLDGLCMTLLSPEDKETLYSMAAETPAAFEKLRRILPSEGDRLDELPGMLMEIFIASL